MKKSMVEKAKRDVRGMLLGAGIVLPPETEIEITDFGKGNYERIGLGLVIRVDEPEYGSKWLTLLPGQECPNHYHRYIKETFFVIKGDVCMWTGGGKTVMKSGDKVTIPPGGWHRFSSEKGAVIEEITTRQIRDDSYFEDKTIKRYVDAECD